MDELNILYLLIFVILSLLVISNTYNIYRLSNQDYKRRSLMDMSEFDNLHPILKELYHEVVVNGFAVFKHLIINDIIKMNNLDKWYNANRNDLLELIQLLREFGELARKDLVSKKFFKMSPTRLASLHALDIKTLVVKTKEELKKAKKESNS